MGSEAVTLGELVSPLAEGEFLSLLRQRKLTHIRGAARETFAGLLGWNALRRMIEQGDYPHRPDYFRVAKESTALPPERWVVGGKVNTGRLEECLSQGFSIVVTHIEQHVPALAALCAEIRSRLSENTYIGAIVTTGSDGAFRLHYDFEDLVILQVEGCKRWQIYGPAVMYPVRGMPKQTPPQGDPIFDQVLEPGDFLFVPAGNWHHCQTQEGRSIHLGIFLIPPTSWHAIKAMTSELLSDEVFRVPLTRVDDAAGLAALEADVKKRLFEKISKLRLSEFRAEWN